MVLLSINNSLHNNKYNVINILIVLLSISYYNYNSIEIHDIHAST